MQATTKKRLKIGINLAVLVLLFWFVYGTLQHALAELADVQWHFNPFWFIVAGGFYLLGLLPACWFWHRVMNSLGQSPRFKETLRAYYIGHLGKYVPGKALVIVLRAGLIKSSRVKTSIAAASVFVETLTMMAAGSVLSAMILIVVFPDNWYLMYISIGLMLAAGLPTLPPVFRKLVSLAGVGRRDPQIAKALGGLNYRLLLCGWLAMILGWCIMGLSLWATIRAMGIDDEKLFTQIPTLIATVSLSMVAGFLSLIPGGLGVREMVITPLLKPVFKLLDVKQVAAHAVSAAVLIRLIWLIAELLISAVLYLIGRNWTKEDELNSNEKQKIPPV